MERINVRVPNDLKEAVRLIAEREGVSQASVGRLALRRLVDFDRSAQRYRQQVEQTKREEGM
jgi:Arc/MetJ-type ribon-helix-helix transcriptional regulator